MEMINYLQWQTRRTHYALGPTLRQEGKFGFDVSIRNPSGAILVQFKRAYRNGDKWTWKLNRTSNEDQHRLLLKLENWGIPVYYGFPFFCEPHHIYQRRRRLLLSTFWFRPSTITVPNQGKGHHEVHFDEKISQWWMTSEVPEELPDPVPLAQVLDEFDEVTEERNAERLISIFNEAIEGFEEEPDLLSGMDIFVRNAA